MHENWVVERIEYRLTYRYLFPHYNSIDNPVSRTVNSIQLNSLNSSLVSDLLTSSHYGLALNL